MAEFIHEFKNINFKFFDSNDNNSSKNVISIKDTNLSSQMSLSSAYYDAAEVDLPGISHLMLLAW